jgi:hypothetical protein
MSFSNNNINPRPCVYGCGIQIYWNSSVNEYWEVLTKKRHICPNIVSNKNKTSITPPSNAPKPYYYNSTKKASSFSASSNQKPKMSNSFELLTGIETIRKKYEVLSDLVTEYNGKVHGSQSHIIAINNMQLVVYNEIPDGKREEVKQKFNNFVRNQMVFETKYSIFIHK